MRGHRRYDPQIRVQEISAEEIAKALLDGMRGRVPPFLRIYRSGQIGEYVGLLTYYYERLLY